MFVSDSLISELSLSNCSCIVVNRGEALVIIVKIADPRTGITINMTIANCELRRKAIITAPINITGERKTPLNKDIAKV